MTRIKSIPETVTVHVPFRLVTRGGRKEIVLPTGTSARSKIDNTLVKALARAFRWKRMLETGSYATIAELAKREEIAPSYLTRVLQLTLLAPDIVESVLDGRSERATTVAALLMPRADEWALQRPFLLSPPNAAGIAS